MNTAMITKWLGKRRMTKVGKMWSEGNGGPERWIDK